MRKEERNDFFAKTLPKMVKLALQLPLLCTMVSGHLVITVLIL